METRKGILTPDQEKLLDEIYKSDNVMIEAADGYIIQLADNQGLERLKNAMEEKYPGSSDEFLYPVVDGLLEIVKEVFEAKS